MQMPCRQSPRNSMQFLAISNIRALYVNEACSTRMASIRAEDARGSARRVAEPVQTHSDLYIHSYIVQMYIKTGHIALQQDIIGAVQAAEERESGMQLYAAASSMAHVCRLHAAD